MVLDMDETLGHFEQISIFWQVLIQYFKKEGKIIVNNTLFYQLIDIFNKILRPNILNILEYLKRVKYNNLCDKIIIYSNNTSKEWCNLISYYFNHKLQYKLFDKIIAAYKVNGKIIEQNRSDYNKNFSDLINCAKLSYNTQVCFLDDLFHPDMKNPNVFYLKIKPYIYTYSIKEMVIEYYNKNTDIIINKGQFINFMIKNINLYNYKLYKKSQTEEKLDVLLSKQLLEHINSFFTHTGFIGIQKGWPLINIT